MTDTFAMAELDERPTPESSWLSRRREAFGASELAMVLAITGRHPIESLPAYMRERCEPMKRPPLHARRWADMPRLYLEKAGVVRAQKAGPAAKVGQDREQELLRAWVTRLVCGDYAFELEAEIDVASVRHASSVPKEWFPLVARKGRVAVTPDAWARTETGDLFDVEIKCSTADVHELRWSWLVQVQAQGLATGSSGAIVVAGSRWARDAHRRDDGPVVRALVEPDEKMRAEIVESSEEAWAQVENIKRERGA